MAIPLLYILSLYLINLFPVILLDASAECTAYYYAPVATHLGSFPPIWQPATLLANDTAGQAKWKSIQSSIPTNIPVKGTLAGDFSNFTPSYSHTDPDCWWTYDKCVTPKLSGLTPDVSNVPEPLSLGYGFDDGPNCSHNAFYDYLSQQNQKASKLFPHHAIIVFDERVFPYPAMFYIGSNVMDWPLEAQRGLADGHEICVRESPSNLQRHLLRTEYIPYKTHGLIDI